MPSLFILLDAQGSGEDRGERSCYENRLAESERSDLETGVHREYRQGGGRGAAATLLSLLVGSRSPCN
jgi:hypothetical protein